MGDRELIQALFDGRISLERFCASVFVDWLLADGYVPKNQGQFQASPVAEPAAIGQANGFGRRDFAQSGRRWQSS